MEENMPNQGPISQQLAGKHAKEKARLKVKEMAKAVRQANYTPARAFTRAYNIASFTVTAHDQPFYVSVTDLSEDDDRLVAVLTIRNAGNQLIPFNNPLCIYNPPILIPDGTYTETHDEFGDILYLANMKEDPAEAFRLVVEQVLKLP